MRRAGFFLILFAGLSAQAFAALTAATTWYVDGSAGNDNNAGCFTFSATSGTNFAINAGGYNFTNLASSNGTTNPSIVTSASHNFVAADVGNCLRVTAGTNWTAGTYRIVSAAANAATLDRAVGSAASLTNGTFIVGGAYAAIATAVSATGRVGSEQIFVKASATYTITAAITLNTAVTPSSTVPPNQIVGYTTTPGDAGRASITLSTNTGLVALDGTGITGWFIRNFTINCASLGTSTGIILGDNSVAINVKVSNCTTAGVVMAAANYESLEDSEITACTAACTAAVDLQGSSGSILRNWIHDNVSPGLKIAQRGTVLFNLFSNNSGASSDCIVAGAWSGSQIFNNTLYFCGRDGIRTTGNGLLNAINIRNNLIVHMTAGVGITGGAAAGSAAMPQYDGNAYFNNGSGVQNRVNMDDTGTVNAGNAAAPYTNSLDVTLTCDPFVNAAANNYTLNNTAGCGAAARYAGTPGPIPGNSFTGNQGMGAQQIGPVPYFGAFVQ